MRALRHDAGKTRLVADFPDVVAGPGEARVRVSLAGIGPADIKAARQGHGASLTLGHEFVGVVDLVNVPADAAPALRERAALKGRRVVVSPSILCGHCEMCRAGLSAHCRNRRVIGLYGREGCFADYVVVPLGNLVAVPDRVEDERAVLAVTLGAALHTAQMIRAESKSFVTVLGDTLLALLTSQALTRVNASVRLLGARRDRMTLCERWGVKHRLIEEAGRRQDQDAVIDCTGSAAGLRMAVQHVRPRGRIVLASPGASAPFAPGQPLADEPDAAWSAPVDLTPVITNEVQVLGCRDGLLPEAVGLLKRQEIDTAGLVTGRYALDEAMAAMEAAGDERQIKVVLKI